MIKLKSLLSQSTVQEAVSALPPPTVSFLNRPEWHSYAKPASDGAGRQYYQGNIDYTTGISDSNLVDRTSNIIKRFENNPNFLKGGFDKQKKLWFPHRSVEGGNPTIAYGHKIQKGEDFSQGITDTEAEDLLHKDIQGKIALLKTKVKGWDGLPMTVKIAALNAMFRGDLGPKAMHWLSQNQFQKAAEEYLNNNEYRTTRNTGVRKRMEWNAKVFRSAT
jgi:hypothetical protein